jgi:hypothetical protein
MAFMDRTDVVVFVDGFLATVLAKFLKVLKGKFRRFTPADIISGWRGRTLGW